MKALGLILVILGATAFLYAVLALLAEQKAGAVAAVVLAIAMLAGGALCIDTSERREEQQPTLTDARGHLYDTRVVTITNHFHDTYYSIPERTGRSNPEIRGRRNPIVHEFCSHPS